MARACLGVLLRSDALIDEASIKNFPLAEYAAEHFGDHAEFPEVLSHIRDVVGPLLDADRPHFASWVWMSPPSQIRTRNRQWLEIIPLYYVAARGYRGLVDYLISKRPYDVHVRGHYGTPLHAALGGAHADIAQLLLEYYLVVDVRDHEDVTPLHLAAYHGFLDIIRTLVERNAVINARDSSGNTPLHRAMEDFEEPESVQDRSLDVVKFLLEHGADPDAKNDHHSTPLHQASYYGSVRGAQLMLKYGANVHARSWKGRTPLHRVLTSLDDAYDELDIFFDTMRCLLARGADVDALDDDLATPLHLASYFDCAKGAQLLLEHGANVLLEDKWGRTPLQVASEWDRTEITQLLKHSQSQQKM
jgi:cytohesin